AKIAAAIGDRMYSLQFAPPNSQETRGAPTIFNANEPANFTRPDLTPGHPRLAPSRPRAQDLIKRGFVRVAGVSCVRPAFEVGLSQVVEIATEAPQYVSRGAEKLVAALDRFGFDAAGLVALDVGASTGGFTQVLLECGA